MALSMSPATTRPRVVAARAFGLIGAFALSLSLGWGSAFGADEDADYPLRAQYRDVPLISMAELRAKLGDVTVVDVRSEFEYSVLRIQGAVNLSVSDHRFPLLAQEMREALGKPLVLYCNGHTCAKSYKAGRLAQHAGLKDTRTYDGGIDDWAHTYPELTELLEKPLTSTDRLIGKDKLAAHLLSPEDFAKKVPEAVVVDIRSPLERAGLRLFVGRERYVELDNLRKLDRLIERARDQNKPFLVYDAAGREVPWLQYYLEEQGLHSYWFMQGGARAFFDYLQSGGG